MQPSETRCLKTWSHLISVVLWGNTHKPHPVTHQEEESETSSGSTLASWLLSPFYVLSE